jgi:hypothetical protein
MASSVATSTRYFDTLHADALAELDRIEANSDEMPNILLRGITLMMVVDARQVLSGEMTWPQDQIDCLVRQIISGEFAESVPGIVK